MKIELDGEKYYRSAEALSNNDRVKRTFKRLSEDEHLHYGKFKGLFEVALRARGIEPDGIDTEEGLYAYIDSGIFNKNAGPETIKDAVMDGEIVELRSILFYQQLLKNSSSDGNREVLNEIIEQERMHLNILKSWEAAV